ncbi:MAG: hypothetical protein CSA52_01010 [Gammaproteobacteria bacterium]|nr:MAG: hypothetical protein CSA52_01010 [Gammaproteobacteria bacterium]
MPGLLEGIVAGSSASGTGNLGDIIATLTEMYGAAALAVAVTLPRIGAAFIMLPLLSRETAPALVRNSLYVCLAVVVFPLSAQNYDVNMVSGALWPLILVKEIFLGVVIGLLFGSIFWALGVAGGMLDTQTGSNMASLVDPIQGHQSSFFRWSVWFYYDQGTAYRFPGHTRAGDRRYCLWSDQSLRPADQCVAIKYADQIMAGYLDYDADGRHDR